MTPIPAFCETVAVGYSSVRPKRRHAETRGQLFQVAECLYSANLLHRRSPFSCASSTSNIGSVSHPVETGLLIPSGYSDNRELNCLKEKRGRGNRVVDSRTDASFCLRFSGVSEYHPNCRGACGANAWTQKTTSSERYSSYRRLFCNPRSPCGHLIHHCGCVSGCIFFFAHPAVKSKQVDAQELAKLRRGDYDPIPRRPALQRGISHPGKDGGQHRGGPARIARQ